MKMEIQRSCPTGSRRILLVDDSPVYLRAAARVLERRGFSVVAVDCARAALSAVEQAEYDLVVSDVQMPGMDGFDLAKSLLARALPMPVILVSGDPAPDLGERARRAGAVAFVPKSEGTTPLCSAIDSALGRGPDA